MLTDHYGDEICLSYPKNRKKSQVFFSTKVKSVDIAQKLRLNDSIKSCAGKLREECRNYDFGLNNSYCSSEDLSVTLSIDREPPHGLDHIL